MSSRFQSQGRGLTLNLIADSVAAHLRLLSKEGAPGFECSDQTKAILKRSWGCPPESLGDIRARAAKCDLCSLSKNRSVSVFGQGDENADIVFVGSAPGRIEEEKGAPFSGKAGELLTKIIQGMGLAREDVYICNLVKCRISEDAPLDASHIHACSEILKRQIASISPKYICALGEAPSRALTGSRAPLGLLRGRVHEYCGIPVMPTHDPGELLEDPQKKRPLWMDMKAIMSALKLGDR